MCYKTCVKLFYLKRGIGEDTEGWGSLGRVAITLLNFKERNMAKLSKHSWYNRDEMKFKISYLFQRNPSSKVKTMWVQLVALKVLSIMREIFLITFAKKRLCIPKYKSRLGKKILLMRFLATAKNGATLFLMGMFHRHLVSSENIKVHTLIVTIHFSMYPFQKIWNWEKLCLVFIQGS